jgi:glutamate synthase domain-containing protein 1
MAIYSPEKGILAQITEERDAGGVGFIASLSGKATHSIITLVIHFFEC